MNLIALQIKTSEDFQKNLEHLKSLIQKCEENSIILAPEIALSGFCYDRMQEASDFSIKAIEELKSLAKNKTIALTFITKQNNAFYNTLHIFHNQEILHTQSKLKLFPLGNELEHFKAGNKEDIKILDINGLKVATLICFELRFPQLWEKVKGADVVLNPAMWGLKRKDHYETISKSLALVNQCFVIASNSADENMAKGSAIISPFGNVVKDDDKEIIKVSADLDEIKKVRKYINIGLDKNE
ncbi:carbon-nitrogen hydrolase family protein [Arcobacter roscoffensis]|uniref:Carbon-nitrogen hydrolase family protein n=1 Tax=Arcobacter roscoffensis TaxID=2961520 RepID=A0ABY5E2Z0_9BACT|nr:carbon-nitrogen hydrolase family protein [Arcobacter roscoffensis]UTJ06541.1 carbon-nitrogen hydrolase family protein [Arcobacter roscoffensis]